MRVCVSVIAWLLRPCFEEVWGMEVLGGGHSCDGRVLGRVLGVGMWGNTAAVGCVAVAFRACFGGREMSVSVGLLGFEEGSKTKEKRKE